MIDLPFDLLINISDYCSDKESLYIALTCSDVYKLFNNRFAKTLKYKNKLPNLYINSINSYTSTWASSKDVFPSLSFVR